MLTSISSTLSVRSFEAIEIRSVDFGLDWNRLENLQLESILNMIIVFDASGVIPYLNSLYSSLIRPSLTSSDIIWSGLT